MSILERHYDHDQSSHGNWSTGSVGERLAGGSWDIAQADVGRLAIQEWETNSDGDGNVALEMNVDTGDGKVHTVVASGRGGDYGEADVRSLNTNEEFGTTFSEKAYGDPVTANDVAAFIQASVDQIAVSDAVLDTGERFGFRESETMTTLYRETAVKPGNEPRRVIVQLAQYGETRTVSDGPGMPLYREQFESVRPADRFHVKDSHGGVLIGHGDPATFRETPNPEIEMTIADTAAGRDILALVESGTINSVSMEFNPKSGETVDIDGVTVRSGTSVLGAAFAYNPAHTAPVLATREEETPMNETPTPDAVTADVLTREIDGLRDEITRATAAQVPAAPANEYAELLSYRDLGEFTQAAYRNPELAELGHRALADQITGNNPGVIAPGYINDIKGIVAQSRAGIENFGSMSLPSSGMSVEWPYLDPALDLATLVGIQATEKTAITSVQVDILQGTSAVKTFAGGSDISQQLIERSNPAYLAAYMRIMAIGAAIATDTEFCTTVTAAATAGGVVWDPATGDAAGFAEALFDASVTIETATGTGATFALVASDVFRALGALVGLTPAEYGTQNVRGTASAGSLEINVSGLPVRHGQNLAAGTTLVSNGMTAAFMETGFKTITAPNVELLGSDVAVYDMGATAVFIPGGVITVPAI